MYGTPNAKAPRELSRYAFLIGRWRCESRVTLPAGEVRRSRAEWMGRCILDGCAIADEYRQWSASGELEQFGQNVRSYSAGRGRWILRWHDALAATWLELAPEDLGPVELAGDRVSYRHHLPEGPVAALFPARTIFRVIDADISVGGFTWRAAVSREGGAAWEEVQVITAERAH